MRLAVWEPDEVRWPRVQAVVLACDAQCERLSSPSLDKDCIAQYDAAIVTLQNADDEPDPSLTLVTDLHAAGLIVVAHASHLRAWTVRAKCRALLAGAAAVVDDAADFEGSLRAAVSAVLTGIERARDEERCTRELARANGIVGQSASLMAAFRQVMRVSPLSDLPVLICGESGTGKELFANAIHGLDPKRCKREMVAINCAAINPNVAESELFGHTRGAYTGAVGEHGGLFGAADGGVLFLDEIGELNLELQAKLLRVLQEKRMRRVGAAKDAPVDVRVIAATNQSPAHAVRDGKLREDLYYRLNVFAVEIPPLRSRKDDIPLLVQTFLTEFNRINGKNVRAVDHDAMYVLEHYPWPGNIRELRNVIERATILADSEFIELKHLPPTLVSKGEETLPTLTIAPGTTVDEAERRLILMTLEHTRNNKTRAAEVLGISLKTLHNKLNRMKEETGARG
jgi:transcriptional regulator with PAS, ATPase and Fis domain